MYEPSAHHFPNLAFLWPAFAAASLSEIAAAAARQFTSLAVGYEAGTALPEQRWVTPNKVVLELAGVRLRDFSAADQGAEPPAEQGGLPTLLCAPLALHGANISDLAERHSLVGTLCAAGVAHLFVTDWRSASAEMRYFGIDDYLAALNVLVDHIGPPIDLIGMCQGGWMALIYAARFPGKVRKLVLAAAPIDIAAGASPLSALAEASPVAMFEELIRLGEGRIAGRNIQKFWGPETIEAAAIQEVLQSDYDLRSSGFARLAAAFRDWYSWTLDLPGAYFLEVVEKLYKSNALARGDFVALGQKVDLARVNIPIFMLAASDDELVAPEQLFAVERLVGTQPHQIGRATARCRHVGLFMGRHVLADVWPQIARWLTTPIVANTSRLFEASLRRVE